jgi:hypothetical protein
MDEQSPIAAAEGNRANPHTIIPSANKLQEATNPAPDSFKLPSGLALSALSAATLLAATASGMSWQQQDRVG